MIKVEKEKHSSLPKRNVGMMKVENGILRKMQERIVTSFLCVLILSQLKGEPKSAYDVVAFIREKFHPLMSPGIGILPLYLLERDGLIQGNFAKRRWVYTLNENGEKIIQAFLRVNDKIRLLVVNFFSRLSE